MKRIKDLSADDLANYAFLLFIHAGRNSMGAGLIYSCLTLEPNHPLGLRCLTDFLDNKGSEAISAVVLEHIINQKIPTSPESQKEHEKLLFTSKWTWGFSQHKSGQTNLGQENFAKESDFEIEEVAYQAFIQKAIAAAGSREKVMLGAHHLIGLYGGLVHSPSITATDTVIDFLAFTDFETSPDYPVFLEQSTKALVDFEAQLNQ